jgi:hypothetical protein
MSGTRIMEDTVSGVRMADLTVPMSDVFVRQGTVQDQRVWRDVIPLTTTITQPVSITIPNIEPKITTDIIPDITITPNIWIYEPPKKPKYPGGGAGGYGGGGYPLGGGLRTSKVNYMNPVVDIDYLSNLFAPISTGRSTPHEKSRPPVRLLTGQLRSSAKHSPKKGKR